jgi:predicted DCC family thiol-disulfide oxidoreductase YuxK
MIATKAILLFDGDCNLCDRLVSFIIRHDKSKNIMFSPLQSDIGKSLLNGFSLSSGYLKSVVYIKHNRYYLRSSAVLNIFKDLDGGWSLLYGFIVIPSFIRDIFYYVIARTRYTIFGKRTFCTLPQD